MPNSSARRNPRILVIGAGLAGLACARKLKDAGADLVVIEKSRGLGGRIATRRAEDGWRFDHGAQFVTARSEAFRALMQESAAARTVERWRPLMARGARAGAGSREDDGAARPDDGRDRFVGAPGMNAFVKPYADGLEVRFQRRVTAVRPAGDRWRVETAPETVKAPKAGRDAGGAMAAEGMEAEAFDIVVCAAPAPQAAALAAEAAPDLALMLGAVQMRPCWAAMIGFAGRYEPGFDVWRAGEDALAPGVATQRAAAAAGLSWICRNASKPGRDPHKDGWVVHASPAWSERFLETTPHAALSEMLDRVRAILPAPLPEIVYARAHRWRYALTAAPLGAPYACDDTGRFFAVGDWCLGARAECAFESGAALGAALAARLDA